jgi:hypothetical protein
MLIRVAGTLSPAMCDVCTFAIQWATARPFMMLPNSEMVKALSGTLLSKSAWYTHTCDETRMTGRVHAAHLSSTLQSS